MSAEVADADGIFRKQLMLQRQAVILDPGSLQVGNNTKDVEWRSSRGIGSVGRVRNSRTPAECGRAGLRTDAYPVRRRGVDRRVVTRVRRKRLKKNRCIRIAIRHD